MEALDLMITIVDWLVANLGWLIPALMGLAVIAIAAWLGYAEGVDDDDDDRCRDCGCRCGGLFW